jgi:hypothetical protein
MCSAEIDPHLTAIIACTGSLAQINPSSLMMVVVASVSNLSVSAMFLAGALIGLSTRLGLLASAYAHARRGGPQYRRTQHYPGFPAHFQALADDDRDPDPRDLRPRDRPLPAEARGLALGNTRRHGVSEQSLYRWKAKAGGLEDYEVRRVKQLEAENAK